MSSAVAERAPLSAEALIAEARAATGLSDFGPDQSFMTGFRRLVDAVEAMDPPAQLRETAHRKIVGLLATRLRFAEDERLHPDIVAQDVGDPLIDPHVLRHSIASRLLRDGTPMKHIADILRHRSLDTSKINWRAARGDCGSDCAGGRG